MAASFSVATGSRFTILAHPPHPQVRLTHCSPGGAGSEVRQLRRDLQRWLAVMGVPALLVTHDRAEVLELGQLAVIMSAGRVCQSGTVEDVFAHPASAEVARIVGVE